MMSLVSRRLLVMPVDQGLRIRLAEWVGAIPFAWWRLREWLKKPVRGRAC
jgi:hypothetical protein